MSQPITEQRAEIPAYYAEAAQLWCKPQFSEWAIDPEFAQAIASLIQMEVTKAVGVAGEAKALRAAAKNLYDNRLGWSDGRNPYAPPVFWDALRQELERTIAAI